MDDGRLHVVIDGDASELRRVFEQISEGFKKTQDNAERTGRAIENSFSGLSSTLDGIQRKLRGALSVAGATAFVRKVFEVRSYFQDIESSMEVFLGSAQKASKFTSDLKDYAWYNTFEFDELAAASKQLIAYGTAADNVIPIIDKLSNVATATKQPLMELVQIYNKSKNIGFLDMRTTQQWASRGLVLTDVLKEMGETVNGTKITFEQLDKALDHVTQEGGMFAGIMEKMMPNLSMSMGQLQDDLSLMWNEIGEAMQDPMHDAIDFADKLVSNYKEIGSTVASLVAVFGAYKAAVITVTAVEKAAAAGAGALTTAEKAHYAWIVLSEKAQKALNKTMLANPYVLVATALAACVAGFIKLKKATDTTVMSAKEMNKQLAKAHSEYETEKEDLDELFGKLRAAKKGTADYEDAKDKIIKQYGKYQSGLATELESVDGLEKAYKSLKDSILEAAKARQYANAKNTLDATFDDKSSSVGEKILEKFRNYYGDENGYKMYYQLLNDISDGNLKLGNDAFNTYGKLSAGKNASNPWGFDFLSKGTNVAGWKINDLQDLIRRYIEISNNYVDATGQLRSVFFEEDAKTQEVLDNLGGRTKEELEQIIPALKQAKDDFIKGNLGSIPVNLGGFFNFTFDSTKMLDSAISGAEKAMNLVIKNAGGNNGDGKDATEKQLAAAYRRSETKMRNERAIVRKEIDLQHSIREEQIKAMADGTAKSLAENQLNHDKEMEQLRRNREDTLKQLQDNEKAVWLAADPDRKDYQFKTSIRSLPKEYAEMFAEQEQLANESFYRAQQDLLNKYGSIEDRRAALVEDWRKAIEEMELVAKEAIEMADRLEKSGEITPEDAQARRDSANRAVAVTKAERDLSIATFNYNEIKDYGTHDEVREALKAKLDARVAAIEEGKRDVERANADLELATFDYEYYSQYGTKDQRLAALKEKLNKELATVDDAAKEIKAAMNEVALAEEEYGNFDQFQSLDTLEMAIRKVYNAKIKLAEAQKDENEVARLGAEMHQKLYEAMQKYSATYALIFANADNLTKEQLKKAIEETNKAIKEAKDSGDIQAYTELLRQLRSQLEVQISNSGWGFSGIVSGFKGLMQARKDYADALKSGDQAAATTAEGQMSANTQAIAKGMREVSDAFSELGSAMEGFGGTIGEIGKALSGLASNTDNIVTAFTSTNKGEIISSGISSAISLLSMVGNQIKQNKEYQEQWNRTIEEAAFKYQQLQIDALDYKQQNLFGVENPYKKAIDGAFQYAEAMKVLNENIVKLEEGQVQTGTKKVTDWGNVGKGVASGAGVGAAIGTAVGGWAMGIGTVIGTAIGAVFGGLTGLFGGKKEVPVFESLKSQYGELFDDKTYELNPKILADYNKLDEATKQIVDNWEAIRKKALEAEEQMRQNFADLAGDVGNQLADSLVQAFRNGELNAAIDDFHAKMTSTIENIMEQLVFSATMGSMFDELQKRMMDSFGAGGDEDIVDDLIWMENEYQKRLEQYGQAMSEVQNSLDKLGYDVWKPEEEERKGATKSGITASQDSVDESNARLTTIQGHTYEINDNVKKIRQQHYAMLQMFSSLLNHVQGIHKDTTNISSKTDDLQKDVSGLRSDVGKIITNGITIKR